MLNQPSSRSLQVMAGDRGCPGGSAPYPHACLLIWPELSASPRPKNPTRSLPAHISFGLSSSFYLILRLGSSHDTSNHQQFHLEYLFHLLLYSVIVLFRIEVIIDAQWNPSSLLSWQRAEAWKYLQQYYCESPWQVLALSIAALISMPCVFFPQSAFVC